jgi:hypothetical protein
VTTVDALTRSKRASQALKPNDLRDVNQASISPLVPCRRNILVDDRRCSGPLPSLPLHGPPSLSVPSLAFYGRSIRLSGESMHLANYPGKPPFCSLLFCSSLIGLIAHCSLPTGWSVYCCFICIRCMHRSLILVTHSHLNPPYCTAAVLDRVRPGCRSLLGLQCDLLPPVGLSPAGQALVIEPESSLYLRSSACG